MGQETRTTDIFGPKLTVETGNPQMGMPGRDSFKLLSTTDTGIRFIQAHTESGLSKVSTEGTMQIEAGAHPSIPADGTNAFMFIAHKGDFNINADKGSTRVYAKQIVLQASKEIVIDAPSIRIGSDNENATKDIKIIAQSVDIQSKQGTLADSLLKSSFLKAFKGTMVADLALVASGSPIEAAFSILGFNK